MNKNTNIGYCFLGIGGISMSALALFLHKKAKFVCGFDSTESKITADLAKMGIKINDEFAILNCNVAVVSSAIRSDDRLLNKCKQMGMHIISRAQLLKEIASTFSFKIGVAGTHGKTTSTAMLAHILNQANLSFCAHIGGLDSEFGNLLYNGNELFLSEVCEYKKNISLFDSDIAVLLNCANDHIESYGSIASLKSEFSNYLARSKTAIVDYEFLNIAPKNAITFSDNNKLANYYASDISIGDGYIEYSVNQSIGGFFRVKINSLYLHDVKNSLSAIATAKAIGISKEIIQKGLLTFKGVQRRSEIMGEINGCKIFADYAHHPQQLKNTIDMLNKQNLKYAVLFQSHTFSRTKMLIKDFTTELSKAKNLFIFDTYAAREKYDYLGSGKRLSEAIAGSVYCGEVENVCNILPSISKKYSLIAVLGAGNLYNYVEKSLNK